MGSLRWMVAVIETTSIWSMLRAVTGNLWRWCWMRGRRTTAVCLLELLALLVIGGWLGVDVVIVFPFAMSLRWCSWGAIITIASCSLCSHRRSWWRCSACNATAGRWVCMVLVWSLVAIARGSCSILNNWSNLWRRASRAAIGRERALRWSWSSSRT